MGDLNPAIDFLDVLSDDIPKGETTVQSTPTQTSPLISLHTKKNIILRDSLQVSKYTNTSSVGPFGFYDLWALRGFVQKTRVYQTNAEKGPSSSDLDTLTHNYFEHVQVLVRPFAILVLQHYIVLI